MSTVPDAAHGAARARSAKRPIKAASAAHRFTLRVPVADTSIAEWWAAQDDPSASVRMLIRTEIMQNGFTDTVNRPVQQMPRRGRPPGRNNTDTGYDDEPETLAGRRAAGTDTPRPEPSEPAAEASADDAAPVSVPSEPVPEAILETAASRQIDMSDIFGHSG